MKLDEIGRQAGIDVRRSSERLAPSLPDGYEVVRRGDRRRTRALAVVAVASLAFAILALVRDGGDREAGLATSPGTTPTTIEAGPTGQVAGQVFVAPCAQAEDCREAPAEVGVLFYRRDESGSENEPLLRSAATGLDGQYAERLPVGVWDVFAVDVGPLDCLPRTITVEEGAAERLDLHCRPAR